MIFDNFNIHQMELINIELKYKTRYYNYYTFCVFCNILNTTFNRILSMILIKVHFL